MLVHQVYMAILRTPYTPYHVAGTVHKQHLYFTLHSKHHRIGGYLRPLGNLNGGDTFSRNPLPPLGGGDYKTLIVTVEGCAECVDD